MKLSTLFRAYQRAIIEVQTACRACEYWYKVDGEHSERALAADRYFSRRSRQKRKLAERITAELARNECEWTYIDESDPATLPPDSGVTQSWYIAAWIDSAGDVRLRKSSFEGGEWYDFGPGAGLWDRGWIPYAWKPWPEAPPLPSEGGEQ